MNNNSIQSNSEEKLFFIAEMSGNHNKSFERAAKIVEEAKRANANAIKVQTFKPDSITLRSKNPPFQIKGSLWDGMTLYDLYEKSYLPWEWHKDLMQMTHDLGMKFIATPFDNESVDFLAGLGVDSIKIASPEIIDIPLIKFIAEIGKPIILSTGMATLGEIELAVSAIRSKSQEVDLAILKCTSAYPAPVDQMNLSTIPILRDLFQTRIGLSDHTIGIESAVVAAALGATVFEKHLTLDRRGGGIDDKFSSEPHEFLLMTEAVITAKKSLGSIRFGPTIEEEVPYKYRRSLYASSDIKTGEVFTHENIKSIRPGGGILPVFYDDVIGKKSRKDINFATPITWDLID